MAAVETTMEQLYTEVQVRGVSFKVVACLTSLILRPPPFLHLPFSLHSQEYTGTENQ